MTPMFIGNVPIDCNDEILVWWRYHPDWACLHATVIGTGNTSIHIQFHSKPPHTRGLYTGGNPSVVFPVSDMSACYNLTTGRGWIDDTFFGW